jgi:ABC-2 type transport system ATP-binding protein
MVKVNNLIKNYGDFKLEVSLEIHDGAVTGIIGKNGAGKSTTIKSILGLIKPDGGSITIEGKDVSALTVADREMMGVALSDSGFSNYITVKDVIYILRKMYPTFDEAFFRKQCDLQGLPLDKKLKDFSTGMKAKVRVLVAISHKANLLVMDEPTSGLDVGARNEVLDLLRDYLEANDECSILLTSHISTDLEGLCDDIYMINDGKVILHEDTDAILGRYGILKVDEENFEKLDKNYILSSKKTGFGYSCITNERQYYLDNYPGIVVENGNIDDLILLMTGGK